MDLNRSSVFGCGHTNFMKSYLLIITSLQGLSLAMGSYVYKPYVFGYPCRKYLYGSTFCWWQIGTVLLYNLEWTPFCIVHYW